MKRLLPGLCCGLLLSALGPIPSASAGWWPWHRHSKSASASSNSAPAPNPSESKAQKSPKPPKEKKTKHHHEKAAKVDNAGVVTTPGPHSVGWWHKQPGPAGAGAN